MSNSNFEIVDDTLVRRESAFTCEGGMFYEKRIPVITKEEFIACYKAWIGSEVENGRNSNQDT